MGHDDEGGPRPMTKDEIAHVGAHVEHIAKHTRKALDREKEHERDRDPRKRKDDGV